MASDKANPRIQYVKSWFFSDGFLEYAIIKLPKTDPIPAPLPPAPTVAAPAPTNFAALISSAAASVAADLLATIEPVDRAGVHTLRGKYDEYCH